MINVHRKIKEPSDSIKRYIADIKEYPSLSREEELELTRRIQNGDDQAFNALVKANLRFVMSIAKEYRGKGLAFEDLVSEGNLGLLKAAHRFNADYGVKFISYAVWWIRQSILAALAQDTRTIRLPMNRIAVMRKLAKSEKNNGKKNGSMPPPVQNGRSHYDNRDFFNSWCLSLEQVVLSPDIKLIDTIKSESCQSPDHDVLQESLQKEIDQILMTLEPREAKILRLYFGLHGRRPQNLDEIGKQLKLSKERVRQIKEKALLHIRRRSRSEPLRKYIG